MPKPVRAILRILSATAGSLVVLSGLAALVITQPTFQESPFRGRERAERPMRPAAWGSSRGKTRLTGGFPGQGQFLRLFSS